MFDRGKRNNNLHIGMNHKQERLAFFLPDLTEGGAQRVILNLIGGIADYDFAIDLVLVRAIGPYLADVPAKVRIIDLGASRLLACLPSLRRYLRQERPKILFSATSYANIIALWAKFLSNVTTRVIVSEHSVASCIPEDTSSWGVKLIPQLRNFYRWADNIIAVSHEVRCDLAKITGIPREQIKVIYNPVITPDLREKANIPFNHPWYDANHPPVLLAVGRLAPEKDFITLIQSFAILRKTRYLRLIILGEGPERLSLEALISQHGLQQDVSLPGFMPNPYVFMAKSSVFILSSIREALPTVLIEALYCGIPCIATDCPGGTREILQNGRFGRLVPVRDPVALADAIEMVLDNVSHQSTESWLPFEREIIVEQYIKLFSEM